MAADAQPVAARILRDCPGCPELVVVPRGTFLMGSTDGEATRDEGPVHRVTIPRPFALGRYELTIGQFRRFVEVTGYRVAPGCRVHRPETATQGKVEWGPDAGRSWSNPGYATLAPGDDLPVACVGRVDALAYLAWLSKTTGHAYRLPSEAEWEYAARAGSTTAFYWGNNSDNACQYANLYDRTAHRAFEFGWSYADCEDRYVEVAPVGHFAANAFGLYDMLGNVWEWTADCYQDQYAGAPVDGRPLESTTPCEFYSVRGGGWMTRPSRTRVSFRGRDPNDARYNYFGFRVARDLAPRESQ
jgi:formylglycine-generating enzyme required for sulfatase activity